MVRGTSAISRARDEEFSASCGPPQTKLLPSLDTENQGLFTSMPGIWGDRVTSRTNLALSNFSTNSFRVKTEPEQLSMGHSWSCALITVKNSPWNGPQGVEKLSSRAGLQQSYFPAFHYNGDQCPLSLGYSLLFSLSQGV